MQRRLLDLFVIIALVGVAILLLSVGIIGVIEQYTSNEETQNISVDTENQSPIITGCEADDSDSSDGLTLHFVGDAWDDDGYIESYYWILSDGTTSTEPSFIHTFKEAGAYSAKLMVTDDEGAVETRIIDVIVQKLSDNSDQSEFLPWLMELIGTMQTFSENLDGTIGDYGIVENLAETVQEITGKYLSDIGKFNLSEEFNEIRNETRACLEAFRQCGNYTYKSAMALKDGDYSNALHYFDIAREYRIDARDHLLNIIALTGLLSH